MGGSSTSITFDENTWGFDGSRNASADFKTEVTDAVKTAVNCAGCGDF